MHTTRTGRALVCVLLLAALTACGTSSDSAEESEASGHNAADVAFATQMIPHHAQAVHMVDMTEGRPLSEDFHDLTHDIRHAQAPEIETMSGWLEAWGEPVPETTMGHHGSGHGMPGMMSQDQLDGLADASDNGFEAMWLAMMIEHHQGAIDMARVERAEGSFPDAIALAEAIETAQLAEIETMEAMLAERR